MTPLRKVFPKLLRRRGWKVALLWLTSRALLRVSTLRVLLISVHRPEGLPVDPAPVPAGIELRLLHAAQVRAAAGPGSIAIDEDFLRGADLRGDECVAAFDGNRMVSYGWGSTGLAAMAPGWLVGAGEQCVYGYKTATLPSYRGRGLSTCVVLRQHMEAFARGKVVVAYTDASNDRALVSASRLGRPRIGVVLLWGKDADARMWLSPIAREVGFTIRQDPGVDTSQTQSLALLRDREE